MANKEKLPSSALVGGEKGSYNHFKNRAKHSNQLKHNIIDSAPDWAKKEQTHLLRDLEDCNKWMKFRHFPRFKELTPVNKITQCSYHCRRDKLCNFCAIRKSQKVFHQIKDKIELLGFKENDLHLVTISPRNERSLKTGINLNRDFVKKLFQGRKDAGRKKSAKIENAPWSAVDGWIGKLETTYNENGTWHPHYHFLVAPKDTHKDLFKIEHIPNSYGSGNSHYESRFAQLLGSLLFKFTKGDSYIVHTRPIVDMGAGIAEVSKYLFKFSSMPAEKTWEVAKITKGMRLATTGGIFRGIKLDPEKMEDEIDLSDNSRPWIDFMLAWDGLTLRDTVRDSYGLDLLENDVLKTVQTETSRIEEIKKNGYNHFLKVYNLISKTTEIIGAKFDDGSIDYFQMIGIIKDIENENGRAVDIQPLFQNSKEEKDFRESKEAAEIENNSVWGDD